MKEEIKEILDYIDDRIIPNEKWDKVKEYITNLAKENEILKENAIHNDKVVDHAKWEEILYKSRNEKAIELIHKAMAEADITGNGTLNLNELEKILKGEK